MSSRKTSTAKKARWSRCKSKISIANLRTEPEMLISAQEGWAHSLRDNIVGLCHNFCHTESLFPPSDGLCHSANEGGSSVKEGLSLCFPNESPGPTVYTAVGSCAKSGGIGVLSPMKL